MTDYTYLRELTSDELWTLHDSELRLHGDTELRAACADEIEKRRAN